ncbi:retrovirus-related pol polyprotein from transposon TNT 1-94 [Tanacetum coccineum]
MPMKKLQWKSPFEVLFGKQSEYSHLRTIGCLCYAAVVKPHKDKFENRGIKCVLIGYPSHQKGYQLYNLETKEVFSSRDVVFQEDVFPFKESTETVPNLSIPTGLANVQQTTHLIVPPIPPITSRKSTRNSAKPAWLKDFVTPKSTNGTAAFCSAQPHYKQAMTDPGWVEAMDKELEALERNNTWELTTLPAGHKPITSKWVYKIKYNPDATIERVLIALTTAKECDLHQLDINNAFLHGYIDEEIYMTSRQWNQELAKFLLANGYAQSKHDYSLFVKSNKGQFTAVLVYLDDVLITGNCTAEILSLKAALHNKFTIKDLGLAKYFLGIVICRTSIGTYLNQRKYILDLLIDTGLTAAKPKEFPLPTQLKLSLNKGNSLKDHGAYRRTLICKLPYIC